MKKYLIMSLILLLAACSGTRVLHTETGDNADLTRYQSFDFFQVKASGDTVSALFSERINVLKEAITVEMERRGYQYTTNHPQLLVNIGIRIKEEVQTRETDWRTDGAPRYIGQRNYSWKSEVIEVGRYHEGTVAIHLVDAAENKMVWRGIVRGIVPENQKNVQAEVQKGISMLFDRFPVPKKQ